MVRYKVLRRSYTEPEAFELTHKSTYSHTSHIKAHLKFQSEEKGTYIFTRNIAGVPEVSTSVKEVRAVSLLLLRDKLKFQCDPMV